MGIWVKPSEMNKVKFNTLKKYGITHIFLNAKTITKYGKSKVEKFIKKAKSMGIKTHIWVPVFYKNKKWTSPVTKKGKYKYNYINSRIKLIKKYASIKGIAGIHLDYLRFPGTAHKYKNAIKAISYFTKKCVNAIKKKNPNSTVSAAVMAESMRSMKIAYGQNIPILSKYLDIIIPMAYKSNYKQNRKWIKRVTKNFVKNSKHAEIWTGLQTYKSNKKKNKLSSKELYNDAKACLKGGAKGTVLFRYGLTNYFDFNTLYNITNN